MIIKSELQDTYLKHLQTTKTPVTIFLVTGVQIRGVITSADNYTIEMNVEGRQQILYKQMVSTIAPVRPVNLMALQTKNKG